MTAYTVQKLAGCPVQLTLLEASARLGGKILTPRFDAMSVRYEAGAAEFYDYSVFDDDPLKELIAELGLPVRPMGGPSVVMQNRILANVDDIRDSLGERASQALLDFDRQAKDRMTPREFYYSDDADGVTRQPDRRRFDTLLAEVTEPAAREYIENLIHSDLATEPARTSLGYGLQNYLMNDANYMHLYGIEGGNERLPQELAARIHADVRLEHRVESIERTDDGRLRVSSSHEDIMQHDDFDFVVIALPHSHLDTVDYRGERLAGAMQRHHARYDFPAHYLRITVLFEQPFWRGSFSDSYWMLDAFGGCCLYDESSRDPGSTHGILGWLLGGEAAQRMSAWSDEALISAALDSLPGFLSHGCHDVIEGRVHRWVGAVNAIPGGIEPAPVDRRHQPEPIDHANLFVVGDYLFDSTLNGVLDSAQYVSAWLAAEMTDNLGRER
jgi:monoamine oxidase